MTNLIRMGINKMKLVSACLLGHNCKYDGGNNLNIELIKLLENEEIIPVCPEELGGLSTPRLACEIQKGTGETVLNGEAKVYDKKMLDVTKEFIDGACETLNEALKHNVDLAILKSRSPSCGVGKIYDGSFSSILIDGDGVTAAILRQNGIKVVSEDEFIKGEVR